MVEDHGQAQYVVRVPITKTPARVPSTLKLIQLAGQSRGVYIGVLLTPRVVDVDGRLDEKMTEYEVQKTEQSDQVRMRCLYVSCQ